MSDSVLVPNSTMQQHVPPPEDDRLPKTRRRLMFFDRAKIIIILGLIMFLSIAKLHGDLSPIMSWGDAIRDQFRGKWFLFVFAGVEVLRQLHYFVSERSGQYHQWWVKRVWGRWGHFAERRNPWLRFRVERAVKVAFWVLVFCLVASWRWDVSPITALIEAPSRVWNILFGPAQDLPMFVTLIIYVGFAIMQFVAIFWFMSRGGIETYMPEDVKTRFADVWGQDHVVDRVRENLIFLEQPRELESRGGHVPGGILLWGPPGTGKTLMAEAMAGETGKPYVFVEPGAFQNMFMGVGVLKVRSLFKKLRKLALRYGGAIVFFDEADVLGNRGGAVSDQSGLGDVDEHARFLSPMSQKLLFEAYGPKPEPEKKRRFVDKLVMPGMRGGSMGELQTLLAELSGLKKPRGMFWRKVRQFLTMPQRSVPKYRILVVMATNMPSSLDPALLRPGRLDRVYKVGYPAKAGRLKTYEGYFGKVKHSVTPAQLEKLATMTPYATGASIKDLVNESVIVAMRRGRDFITWPDVVEARKLKMVGPGENVEYVERERHATAIHEACHAIMAYRVRKGHDIDIATIEKGGDFLGFVSRIPLDEQFTNWKSTFEADVMVSLASLAGEKEFFDDDSSSGVSGDLRSATGVSLAMEAYLGMGGGISSFAADRDGESFRVHGEMLRGRIGEGVETRLQELYQRALSTIRENRFEILAITHALEAHKTITGEDIDAIVRGYPGPIVDGRPYHEPQFIEMAERYHARVLAAHREQGKVDMALPTWVTEAVPSVGAYGSYGNGSAPSSGTSHNGVVQHLPPPAEPPKA